MFTSRVALSAIALATALSAFPLSQVAAARANGANTNSGRAFVIVPPAQKPMSSKPSAPKPPQRWPMANTKPVVVAPPPPKGPLAGKPLPYKPPVVVAPPKPNGPLAGKPVKPYRPYRPVVDASNAPGGVVVTVRPRPVKPVTCIGPAC